MIGDEARTGTKMIRVVTAATALLALLAWATTFASRAGAQELAPWLDVPAAWSRTVQQGVVAVSPNDLAPGAQLILMVEPATKAHETLAAAYEQALRDLGPWRPVDSPVEQRFDNGWVFRLGVGVTTLEGRTYTAETAVARRGDLQVRFWVLANSDATFNRYKAATSNAIASAQDITRPPARAAPPPAAPVRSVQLDARFGKGISGVYVGLERGLSLSAGMGAGTRQTYNQSTSRYETSPGAVSQLQTHISDYTEVDVFFPDGTYRRKLPVRGLPTQLGFERQAGTWQRQGNKIVVRRGTYTTSYTIQDDHTLISDRGRSWTKVASPHGRLDGVYAHHNRREAGAPRLVLHADGRYEDRGGFLHMVGTAWNLVVPDGNEMLKRSNETQARRVLGPGGGTYTVQDYTLTLRDRDGRVWQFSISLLPSEGDRPRHLVINERDLVRE